MCDELDELAFGDRGQLIQEAFDDLCAKILVTKPKSKSTTVENKKTSSSLNTSGNQTTSIHSKLQRRVSLKSRLGSNQDGYSSRERNTHNGETSTCVSNNLHGGGIPNGIPSGSSTVNENLSFKFFDPLSELIDSILPGKCNDCGKDVCIEVGCGVPLIKKIPKLNNSRSAVSVSCDTTSKDLEKGVNLHTSPIRSERELQSGEFVTLPDCKIVEVGNSNSTSMKEVLHPDYRNINGSFNFDCDPEFYDPLSSLIDSILPGVCSKCGKDGCVEIGCGVPLIKKIQKLNNSRSSGSLSCDTASKDAKNCVTQSCHTSPVKSKENLTNEEFVTSPDCKIIESGISNSNVTSMKEVLDPDHRNTNGSFNFDCDPEFYDPLSSLIDSILPGVCSKCGKDGCVEIGCGVPLIKKIPKLNNSRSSGSLSCDTTSKNDVENSVMQSCHTSPVKSKEILPNEVCVTPPDCKMIESGNSNSNVTSMKEVLDPDYRNINGSFNFDCDPEFYDPLSSLIDSILPGVCSKCGKDGCVEIGCAIPVVKINRKLNISPVKSRIVGSKDETIPSNTISDLKLNSSDSKVRCSDSTDLSKQNVSASSNQCDSPSTSEPQIIHSLSATGCLAAVQERIDLENRHMETQVAEALSQDDGYISDASTGSGCASRTISKRKSRPGKKPGNASIFNKVKKTTKKAYRGKVKVGKCISQGNDDATSESSSGSTRSLRTIQHGKPKTPEISKTETKNELTGNCLKGKSQELSNKTGTNSSKRITRTALHDKTSEQDNKSATGYKALRSKTDGRNKDSHVSKEPSVKIAVKRKSSSVSSVSSNTTGFTPRKKKVKPEASSCSTGFTPKKKKVKPEASSCSTGFTPRKKKVKPEASSCSTGLTPKKKKVKPEASSCSTGITPKKKKVKPEASSCSTGFTPKKKKVKPEASSFSTRISPKKKKVKPEAISCSTGISPKKKKVKPEAISCSTGISPKKKKVKPEAISCKGKDKTSDSSTLDKRKSKAPSRDTESKLSVSQSQEKATDKNTKKSKANVNQTSASHSPKSCDQSCDSDPAEPHDSDPLIYIESLSSVENSLGAQLNSLPSSVRQLMPAEHTVPGRQTKSSQGLGGLFQARNHVGGIWKSIVTES